MYYSVKAGERLKSPKKIYTVDNGFISAKAIQHSPDKGKLTVLTWDEKRTTGKNGMTIQFKPLWEWLIL